MIHKIQKFNCLWQAIYFMRLECWWLYVDVWKVYINQGYINKILYYFNKISNGLYSLTYNSSKYCSKIINIIL